MSVRETLCGLESRRKGELIIYTDVCDGSLGFLVRAKCHSGTKVRKDDFGKGILSIATVKPETTEILFLGNTVFFGVIYHEYENLGILSDSRWRDSK